MAVSCREDQIELISKFIQGDSNGFPSVVYLWGPSSSGKSLAVKSLGLNPTGCVQSSVSLRLLFNDLLRQWKTGHVETFGDFVAVLKGLELDQNERHIFTLDSAERLRYTDEKTLAGLLRLRELTNLNVCVLLISQIPPRKVLGHANDSVLVVHFPQYTKKEAALLMAQNLQIKYRGYDKEFYSGYAAIIVGTFYSVCRNVRELLKLSDDHFSAFKEPVDNGVTSQDNLRVLYRSLEPRLRASGGNVLYREVGSEGVSLAERLKVELPFFSKFLLIAAYLASHNPSKSDKRFFVKHHGKQRKTKAMIKAKLRYSSQLTGPKPFAMDRLLAIFYAIVDDRASPTANILSQITTLVTLQYLIQIGGDLDVPKYKCIVGLDFVRNVSRTVNFEIIKYLYDFA